LPTLFAFVFETYLTAALVTVGSVSIPIIIHLLHRRRFRIVNWAAMRFLLAAQRKNSRRIRLEQFILLALRCLMILLLVLAMLSVTGWAKRLWAWAAPSGPSVVAVNSQRAHKILVLDGSFSMGFRDGDAPAFDRARQLALQVVRDSPGGDGFSVILMGAPPRRIVPEPSEDARKVLAEIEGLHVSHGAADLPATLSAVESMLQGSPQKYLNKEVYFFTDLQHSSWILKQPGVVSGTLQKIRDKQAHTILVDVGKDGASNLAVTSLSLPEDETPTTGRFTTVTALLHNFGDTRDNVGVKLLVGRARSATEPGEDLRVVQETSVRAERGQQTPVPFPLKFPSPGEYVLQVQVENDGLEVDDTRSAVLTVRKEMHVLLVNGKPAAETFDQASELLRVVLAEQADAGNLVVKPTVLNTAQFADESKGDLSPYDCVFLCDVPRLSAAEVSRLESHVRRGGGLVICLGDKVDANAYNELLYRNGTGLMPARLQNKQTETRLFNYQFAVEPEAEREPPLKPFAGEVARTALRGVRFHQFYQTEPARGGPRNVLGFAPIAIPGATATGADTNVPPQGGAAVLEWHPPAGKPGTGTGTLRGRVVLVTTTVNCDWADWSLRSYVPLMHELAQFAASGRLRPREQSVGDPIELFLPGAAPGIDVKVFTPDGRQESLRVQAQDDAAVARFNETDASGVYRIVTGPQKKEHCFAVNVPTHETAQQGSESNLARTNLEEIQITYPEWETQLVRDPAQVVHATTAVNGVEVQTGGAWGPVIARWLLLGLLLLVPVEILLSFFFGHYSGGIRTESRPGMRSHKITRILLGAACSVMFLYLAYIVFVLIHDAVTGDFLGFFPQSIRRSIEEGFNVPAPAPGEGSRWHLHYSSYLWNSATDVWIVPALGILFTGFITAVYFVEGQLNAVRPSLRILMMGLRYGLLFLLLAVFLPQLQVSFERQGWPDVVILIDDSQSMSAVDHYRDPRVQQAALNLAQLEGLTEAERLRLAQLLLTRSQDDWLTALLKRREVRLHVYHCSARAQRLKDVNSPDDVAAALEAINELNASPENDSSQLGSAVRQVINDFRGSSLAAVIMLTDGVTTEGEDLGKVSKYAGQMGVPLYFVGLGDAHEARDVYLHDLQVEDNVYVNDRVVFDLRFTAQGYNALRAPVVVKEKGKPEELARQEVTIDGSGKPVKVRLVHQPTEPGEHIYEVSTPKQPDEVDDSNNRLERSVFVQEAKLIKVLYIEGYRRYEYHFIKTLLERESDRTKGNKSIDLKCLLLSADPDYAGEDRTALSDFPTKAELFTYDVVILGDVDPRPRDNNKMTEHMRDLADFAREHGGGLLMIAGQRYAPQAYKDSPLREVLPVELTADKPIDGLDVPRTEAYRPELTPVGRLHPIFRFSPDEKENDEIWGRLRELYWWSEGYQPKRMTEVLAVHPRAKKEGKPAERREGDSFQTNQHALVVQQFVGSGRCLFFGFDETWRWGYREDLVHFNQFWIQTVRYLARSRQGRTELRLDRQTPYRRGEPIKVTVRFPDDAPAPAADTDVKVVVERHPGTRGPETLKLARVEGSRATFETVLTRTPEGEYKFWLSPPAVTGPRPRAECKVLAPPGEMENLRMNQAELERAAEESKGRFYSLADADHLLDELPAGSRVTVNVPGEPWLVWNYFVLFLLALGAISTEWLLRRQMNLL
jgi:hypothetical protein